jgi:bifunctional non-homologous end joining protein LigD
MPARRNSAAVKKLKAYRAKRDFTRSPEPSGSSRPKAKKKKAPIFCVQKHLATNLHYDFRIEHNGLLLSWAIPKGPSLNPRDKRMAMQVEDHPLDYADFEGVIRSGYGAGVVMLWDIGTWTPEVDDIDAALQKGELKFKLDGFKLKGSWVLVKMGARWGPKPSWLLIKHRDEWAGEVDITSFAPLSVKSGGDFEAILKKNTKFWTSHEPGEPSEEHASLQKIVEKVVALKERENGKVKKH